MIARLRGFRRLRHLVVLGILAAFLAAQLARPAGAIQITIDYRYDTNNFFTTNQAAKNALQAAADRYSALVTTPLLAATLLDNGTDPRIGFKHPGTGMIFEVSAAAGQGSDAVKAAGGPTANEYRGPWSINANELIVYAGGRALTAAEGTSEGGTRTGTNFANVYTSHLSHVNRDFRQSGTAQNLPVWGGSISFDNDGSTVWHFNHTTTPPANTADFYTLALHEIGHVLGLNIGFLEWNNLSSGATFVGRQALAAYNTDNGAAVTSLNRVSASNPHWLDGAHNSFIFQNAGPNLLATAGFELQDLLMEPIQNFTAAVKRHELTNVDVAALRDVGWLTVPQPPPPTGDYNNDSIVNAADYAVFSKGFANGSYATWKANFGESLPPTITTNYGQAAPIPGSLPPLGHVPEPTALAAYVVCGIIRIAHRTRRPRS